LYLYQRGLTYKGAELHKKCYFFRHLLQEHLTNFTSVNKSN